LATACVGVCTASSCPENLIWFLLAAGLWCGARMFLARMPRCMDGTQRVKCNVAYWSAKVQGNRDRDARNVANLRKMGWSVFIA
jgi:hypothetical protein